MSEMEKQLTALRRKSYRQSVVISLFVAGFVFALAAFLLWPQAENVKETALQNNRRLVSLENDLTEMDTRIGGKKPHGAFFGGVLPEDIDRKLKDLEEKTGAVQSQVGRIAHEARNIAGELTSADGTPLAERISRLERRLQKVMSADDLQRLFSRIEAYKTNLVAGGELDAAMTQLASLLNSASVETDKTSASTPENNNIMEALKTVRGQDSALGQALADVEDENLKAAAMLLVFTQIRSSLGRNRSSFEKDLQILMRLAGDDNPELKAALEGLAPKAKDGVLTPAGLSKELRSLSGDIVAASLTGEDVSLGEKAKARLGDVLSVEKDGQILTGTDAQKHVQLAQALIDEGRIDEAVEELQKLQGAGRETAEPIIDEAQTLLLAREIETMVKKDIISNLAGEINHIPSTSMNSRAMLQSLWQEIERVTSPKVTYDPASGTAILPRRQLPGFMSQN